MTAARGGRYPNLDGIRGLAIALVFVHHLPPDIASSTLTRNGRYGVTLFFVLSGFLIASRMFREADRRGAVDCGAFLVRRFARIGPAYFAVLALYALAIAGLGAFEPTNRALFLDKLPLLATLTSNWHAAATEGPFFVAWSLGVEVQFYLALALLAWLGGARWIPAFAAALVLLRVITSQATAPGSEPWLVRGVEESIWIGALAAAFARRASVRTLLARIASPHIGLALLSAFVTLLAAVELPHKHGPDTLALALLAAAAVVICAHSPRIPLVSARLTNYIGDRSYGLYLCHMLAILAARAVFDSPWSIGLALVAAIVGAELLYRCVERPGALLVKRLVSPSPAAKPWLRSSARSSA
jgi:peptidoglycan/LPS O-acetylase OafA/YrhL